VTWKTGTSAANDSNVAGRGACARALLREFGKEEENETRIELTDGDLDGRDIAWVCLFEDSTAVTSGGCGTKAAPGPALHPPRRVGGARRFTTPGVTGSFPAPAKFPPAACAMMEGSTGVGRCAKSCPGTTRGPAAR